MKNNTFARFVNDHIDTTVPEWQELGTKAFFSGLAGITLSLILFLGVYYL